ncbi:MAG: hypothetical protein Q7K44_04045 [Candidatus Liptonbacteria bacterium]|nr:hypothetical protein [Candidatus Liptonbacteria bacterium]
MKKILLAVATLLASFLLAGCGSMSVGGHPFLGFESEKDKDGKTVPAFGTVITVHQYGVQTQPPPAPPGTPPTPPALQPSGAAVPPQTISYKTVYSSKWDDPTLVVIQNQSARFVRVKIDDAEEEIRLSPYQATTDLGFDVGEHRLRVTIEKPTAAFGMKTVERLVSFIVRPDSRSQLVQVYDY